MRLFTVFLFFFVAACMSTTDFERLRQDVNGLKRDTYEAQRDLDALKEKTAGTGSFTAVRESQADMNAQLSEISMGLQELRGRFEENRYFVEKSSRESAAEMDLIRARLDSIENRLKIAKIKPAEIDEQEEEAATTDTDLAEEDMETAYVPDAEKPEVPEVEAQPKETVTEVEADIPDDRTNDYLTAYQEFKDKNFVEARKRFESFLKDYPQNELTDNAQFWIAETYYSEQDYEGAILSYETLLKKYPESEKTSGALLKQGFAFIEIGDKKTGRIILEKLIEQYPDSNSAEIAVKKLKIIDKK